MIFKKPIIVCRRPSRPIFNPSRPSGLNALRYFHVPYSSMYTRVGRFWNQAWEAVGKVGQNYFKPSGRFRFFSARVQFSSVHFRKKKALVRPKKKSKYIDMGIKIRVSSRWILSSFKFFRYIKLFDLLQKKIIFNTKTSFMSLIGFANPFEMSFSENYTRARKNLNLPEGLNTSDQLCQLLP